MPCCLSSPPTRPKHHPRNCRGSGSAGVVSAGTSSKSGTAPILKCPTQFPLILWHPSARHYYFCMMTEAEQDKWQAVLQDCIRHCNNGEPPPSVVVVVAVVVVMVAAVAVAVAWGMR